MAKIANVIVVNLDKVANLVNFAGRIIIEGYISFD